MSKSKAKPEPELTKNYLAGLILEAEDRDDMLEHMKIESEEKKKYYDAKAIVSRLEKKNNKRVYLFPSASGEKGEWYLLGGNSALFYKYFLGPRMGRAPKIRKDGDVRQRFKHGVVSVHWIARFIDKAKELKYEVKELDYDIVVVELGRVFTTGEIKDLMEAEKEDSEQLVTMIKPKHNVPSLYAELRKTSRYLIPKVNKMNVTYRQTLGNDMLLTMMRLFKTYFRMANGRMEVEAAIKEMLDMTDDMTGLIAVMDEMEVLDTTTRTRIGEGVIDIRTAIYKYEESEEENRKRKKRDERNSAREATEEKA